MCQIKDGNPAGINFNLKMEGCFGGLGKALMGVLGGLFGGLLGGIMGC